MDTMEKVKNRALEVGVYLPLGAYSKIKESVTDIDAVRLKKRYKEFVDRGEDRVRPLERKVTQRARDLRSDTKRTATKTRKRGQAVASQAAPKIPRVAAPADARGLPITGYEQLTVGEIRARLNGLTQTDLAKVYKYERANQNRSTVLETIESKFIELPIPTYDALTVDEIGTRLDGLTENEISALRKYEVDTKARQTILERMDSKLA